MSIPISVETGGLTRTLQHVAVSLESHTAEIAGHTSFPLDLFTHTHADKTVATGAAVERAQAQLDKFATDNGIIRMSLWGGHGSSQIPGLVTFADSPTIAQSGGSVTARIAKNSLLAAGHGRHSKPDAAELAAAQSSIMDATRSARMVASGVGVAVG